jgi:hypothetical protein
MVSVKNAVQRRIVTAGHRASEGNGGIFRKGLGVYILFVVTASAVFWVKTAEAVTTSDYERGAVRVRSQK